MFCFWICVFQINSFCILFNSFIVAVGILVINARWTILDIANALKTVTFPSNVKFRIRHSFRTFSMLVIYLRKFSSFSIFLLYKKWIPKIFTVFNLKSIHFIPQSVSFALFSALIPATSHLDLLGFKPKNDENMLKNFITSIKDSLSFRKNVVSSAYAVYKKSMTKYVKVFSLFIFLSRQEYYFQTYNK